MEYQIKMLFGLPQEMDILMDAFAKTANRLDNIMEPVLQHDRDILWQVVRNLKQSGGEEWVVGESLERILTIEESLYRQ